MDGGVGGGERLAATGVDHGQHAATFDLLPLPIRRLCERLQAADGDQLCVQRLCQSAGAGHADAKPCERSGAHADGDAIDVGKAQARLCEQIGGEGQQTGGVSGALPMLGVVAGAQGGAVVQAQADCA